jgi:undecaprenyl-diphosphatase
MAPFLLDMLLWRAVPAPLLPLRRETARLLGTRTRVVVLTLALAVGMADLAANHLKDLVDRQRPCTDPAVSELVDARWTVHGSKSFPSSHAANSAAMATVVALYFPAALIPAVALAFLVGFSRIYLGVHYPLDVAAGWLLGALSGGVFYMALEVLSIPRESWSFTRRFRRGGRGKPKPGPVEDVHRDWEPLPVRSLDGLRGTAWLLRGGERLAAVVHGLGADVDAAAVPGGELARRGYSVLLCPVRGHDDVHGRPTSGGPEEAYDLLGALHLAQREGYPPKRTLLYGTSMGAGVCLKAAAITGDAYLALITHGVVPDFPAAAERRLGGLQARLLMRMIPASRRHGLEVWDPRVYASLLDGGTPVVALCGSRDDLSTPQDSEAVSAFARRSMVAVLGGAHHPSWLSERTDMYQYRAAMDRALDFINSNDKVIRIYIDENGEVRNLPSSHREMGAQP